MRSIFILFIFMAGLVSCEHSLVYSRYEPTTNGSWNRDDIMKFELSDMDSVSPHNVYIMVRNDNTFPYSNLFLIAQISTPDDQIFRDTLEFEMAAPDGKWLGKGSGSIYENKLWFRENVVFSPAGVYTLELSHAMRQNGKVEGIDNLNGITDVGIEIELSEE